MTTDSELAGWLCRLDEPGARAAIGRALPAESAATGWCDLPPLRARPHARWVVDLGGPLAVRVGAVSPLGVVAAHLETGGVACVDPVSGAQRWVRPGGGAETRNVEALGRIGSTVLMRERRSLVAVDIETGAELQRRTVAATLRWTAVVHGDSVIVSREGEVASWSLDGLRRRWRHAAPEDARSGFGGPRVIATREGIFYETRDGVVALDDATGALRWRRAGVRCELAGRELLVGHDVDEGVVAATLDGRRRWTAPSGMFVQLLTPAGVVAHEGGGQLVLFDARTGHARDLGLKGTACSAARDAIFVRCEEDLVAMTVEGRLLWRYPWSEVLPVDARGSVTPLPWGLVGHGDDGSLFLLGERPPAAPVRPLRARWSPPNELRL